MGLPCTSYLLQAVQQLKDKAVENPTIKVALDQAEENRSEAARLGSELEAAKVSFAKQKKVLLDKIAILNKGPSLG